MIALRVYTPTVREFMDRASAILTLERLTQTVGGIEAQTVSRQPTSVGFYRGPTPRDRPRSRRRSTWLHPNAVPRALRTRRRERPRWQHLGREHHIAAVAMIKFGPVVAAPLATPRAAVGIVSAYRANLATTPAAGTTSQPIPAAKKPITKTSRIFVLRQAKFFRRAHRLAGWLQARSQRGISRTVAKDHADLLHPIGLVALKARGLRCHRH